MGWERFVFLDSWFRCTANLQDFVFYTTPTADESDAGEFATHYFPGGGQGRWFQELFTNDKKEDMLDNWARKEWTGENKDESDPLVLNRMCRALGEVSQVFRADLYFVSLLMTPQYAHGPVYLMIVKGTKPRKEARWHIEAGPLARRNVKVVTVDPYTYEHWDDDLFEHNPDEVIGANEDEELWKTAGNETSWT